MMNPLHQTIKAAWSRLAPPPRMTVAQWAERYRYMAPEASALPGKYSLDVTPYLRGVLEAITEPGVRKVACMKSAQVGWTDGVINNYLGYAIHVAPGPIGVMFPRDQTAKDFNSEKFIPMVRSTPALQPLVNVKTRSGDNTQNRKRFPGGFVKFFGSNSTGGVKSTPLRVVVVEEPDDCNLNIKGQGDSIRLAEERVKTFHDAKVLVGGTPSIKGLSSIEAEMTASDQRRFLVPCGDCGESHALDWANVKWTDTPGRGHEIYGDADPATSMYYCPHCGSGWDDATKNRYVRRGKWHAQAEFNGVVGFYLNELYSAFPDSKLRRLVEKYLSAKAENDAGEPGALIAFWNSSLGLPYEYQTETPTADALRARAEDYPEMTVPAGGAILTAGVDVQHDRLAVVLRAWGKAEESWLVYWGEIYGQTLVPGAGAWLDLQALLDREYAHASGATLRVRMASIDSGDGQSAEAVYAFVRANKSRTMATKGASEAGTDKEIFTVPRAAVDLDKSQKSWKYGLRPYIVGTNRAKDLILGGEGGGRVKLTGEGPGRYHAYATVRADYFDQLTSEIKAPHRTMRNRRSWQKRSGARNEALDCEVLALHAARALKTNLLRDGQVQALLTALKKSGMAAPADAPESTPTPAARRAPPPRPAGRRSIRSR